MGAEVVVVVVMEPLDGRLPGRAVHPLDLAMPPRVLHLGQSMFDLILPADAVKYVFESIHIAASICELHAVVDQHRVQAAGDSRDQITQKLGCRHLPCLFDRLGKSELACPVNADEQIELSFRRPHFCDVDMKAADGITFEALSLWVVAVNMGQP